MSCPPRPPGRSALVIGGLAVAAVAIAIRLPSCGESFWLDELHSAWAVQDGFEFGRRTRVARQSNDRLLSFALVLEVVGRDEVSR